jgi:metal-dependent amidase/aminoacylase/carboxypeptidase family protein
MSTIDEILADYARLQADQEAFYKVLLRCELDALPVREDTGAPYAATATVTDAGGHEVPAAHACGHDLHVSCMLGMARLMADHRDQWQGTLIPLFQPAEETGEGAQDMADDGLFEKIPVPDVALAQHVLPGIAGTVIVRLQAVVSREIAPSETAVLTVGSCQAGTRSNVIPDYAVLELNIRSYSAVTRQRMIDAIHRIVRSECQASGPLKEPEFETTFSFPVTSNDPDVTARTAKAFAEHFGDNALEIPVQTVSEDFSKIPDSPGVPYTYWGIGFTDRQTYLAAEKSGHFDDLPTSHSPKFLPPLAPTLRTGTEALTAAAWLGWVLDRAAVAEPRR